jgi:hypothetical protein
MGSLTERGGAILRASAGVGQVKPKSRRVGFSARPDRGREPQQLALNVDLLRDLKCVLDLNPEVANRALDLRMAQEQLNSP